MPPTHTPSAKSSDYMDFELEIAPGSGGHYPVAVTHSPAGQAQATMRLAFDEAALEQYLKDLDSKAMEFGQALFDSLFADAVGRLYTESMKEAVRQDKRLRLKLHFQPPELAALPWEFLYDAQLADYVCLSPRTLLMRYQASPQPRWPLLVKTPLRILGVVASPPGLPALDVEAEKRQLAKALGDLQARGLVSLNWLTGQSWQGLEPKLAQATWHVLHFIGHSGFDVARGEDYLVLADSAGEPLRLPGAQLGQALCRQESLRLAVFNVCEDAQIGHACGLAGGLVNQGIPAALVLPHLDDHQTGAFSRAIYEALAGNRPIDAAVSAARESLRETGAGIAAWGSPALYTQTVEGHLFNVMGPAESQVDSVLMAQRAEIERLAGEQAERERQIREANERLAALKAEIERLAEEQAERQRQVQAATEQLTALRAEAARLGGGPA